MMNTTSTDYLQDTREIPSTNNKLHNISFGSLAYAQRAVFKYNLDGVLELSTVSIERSSSASERKRQERIGEDSSKNIPGSVYSLLDGRAKKHDLRRGENGGDMCDDDSVEGATQLASERRYPSVFALSIVFGGAIGQTTFSMLDLPGGGGFLVGFALVFLALASAVLISRARSGSQINESQ